MYTKLVLVIAGKIWYDILGGDMKPPGHYPSSPKAPGDSREKLLHESGNLS